MNLMPAAKILDIVPCPRANSVRIYEKQSKSCVVGNGFIRSAKAVQHWRANTVRPYGTGKHFVHPVGDDALIVPQMSDIPHCTRAADSRPYITGFEFFRDFLPLPVGFVILRCRGQKKQKHKYRSRAIVANKVQQEWQLRQGEQGGRA